MEIYSFIDHKLFTVGIHLPFALYVSLGKNKTLLLSAENIISSDDILKMDKFKGVYIKDADLALYELYLKDIEEKEHSVFISQSKDIYDRTSIAVTSIMDNPEKLDNMLKTEEIVNFLQSVVLNEHFTMKSLLEIMSHDFYTHTHCINVSIYTISFGKFLKLDDVDMKRLGASSVLHDLGKSKIDFNIINNPGKLEPEEFEQMKKHPEIGDYLAKNIGITDIDILSGIRHHHEKMNGCGYPDKLHGIDITLFAKIIGICDIFDALTTKRSYKEPMTTFEALGLMKKNMKDELDPDILNQFILMFSNSNKE